MYIAKYLLSIEEFMNTEKEKALIERAFSCVDETRQDKAKHMRPRRARAACLGAGLLLQLAVGEALVRKAGKRTEDREWSLFLREAGGDERDWENRAVSSAVAGIHEMRGCSVSQLLSCVENMPRLPLSYTYGEKGKPYFRDFPFYFNLSHSGDYVICGLSDVEIGVDIQQHCKKNVGKLARRFFSEREANILEQAGEEREKLFYRLWARKEAYGKLTGRGVAEVLDVDMLPGNWETPERECEISKTAVLSADRRLIWDEYDGIEGYSIVFCVENSDCC